MQGNAASGEALLNYLLHLDHTAGVQCQLAVAVPYPYLYLARQLLSHTSIVWGAQDLSAEAEGARTGEVSGAMLADFDCHFVIVGHSERRRHWLEKDNTIALKAKRALAYGLIPIICVGETETEHENSLTDSVLTAQVQTIVKGLNQASSQQIIWAYEPVWAIGSGKAATPQQAQSAHSLIRDLLPASWQQQPILYGGSVKPSNAEALFLQKDVDGALVGGASLNADQFYQIARVLK